MPAINDFGLNVSILNDFLTLEKWIAPDKDEFRKVLGTRIVNHKGLDLSGIHGYLPDTYSDFEVKNVLKCKDNGIVCQAVKGPWKDTKLETAMEQVNLTLNCDNPMNPYLADDNIRLKADDGTELIFTGRWLIRGWKIDLVINHNKNGVNQVEFFRDEIRWVKVPEGSIRADESQEVFTSTYWLPY